MPSVARSNVTSCEKRTALVRDDVSLQYTLTVMAVDAGTDQVGTGLCALFGSM